MNTTNAESIKPARRQFTRKCPACKGSFTTIHRKQICCNGTCRKARFDAKQRRLMNLGKRFLAQQAKTGNSNPGTPSE